MSGFFAILFLLILPFVFFYSFRRPDLFRIKNEKNPKGQWSRGLFSTWWFVAWLMSLAMIGVFAEPLPDAEKQEIVRQVAAEMNAEPDAKAVITVQNDGAVVIEPVVEQPEPVVEQPEPVVDVKPVSQEGRLWVMENFVVGQEWNPNDWIKRFGAWSEIPVTDMNPAIIKKYYFESIDMTITVNTLKGEAVTWTSGKK